MKTIEQIYEPYNFSATRCYVFTHEIIRTGYLRIEHKLPAYIRNLKGIFISISGLSQTEGEVVLEASYYNNIPKIGGFITLNFNGQALKCFQCSVYQTHYLTDNSHPLPFNELINPNSFVQGYFFDRQAGLTKTIYKLSIYLHYKP